MYRSAHTDLKIGSFIHYNVRRIACIPGCWYAVKLNLSLIRHSMRLEIVSEIRRLTCGITARVTPTTYYGAPKCTRSEFWCKYVRP